MIELQMLISHSGVILPDVFALFRTLVATLFRYHPLLPCFAHFSPRLRIRSLKQGLASSKSTTPTRRPKKVHTLAWKMEVWRNTSKLLPKDGGN